MTPRTVYCCNLNPQFVLTEHHKPRTPYSRNYFKKSTLRLIALQLAGRVTTLQQKTEAGIRTPEFPINAIARNQGVFFCAILSMVAQAGHLYGGRKLMGPVVLTPFGLPPLRLEPHAVATLTHQRVPA